MKNFFLKLPNKVVIALVFIYQHTLSPSTGVFRFLPGYPKPGCIFHPTCSVYTVTVFRKEKFFTALKKTFNRLRRCHPRNQPSVDLP